jgi:NhaC family Na+:H+ antiporter
MLWTTLPAFGIALILFLVLSLAQDANSAGDPDAALASIEAAFSIGPINLAPLVVLIFFSVRRYPPYLSIMGASLTAGLMAAVTQPAAVSALADDSELGGLVASIKAIYISMATGFVSTTGNEAVDSLFSRGGMASMLTTIWLVLGALSFATVMEYAGFLERIIAPILDWARSTARLITAVIGTCLGLNIIAGDQYIADVLPARTYRIEFQKRGIHPQVLSRTIDDTGTVTSPLVPWNSCGAYMSGTLGVATVSYLPYCFLNILNPLISLLYGLTGFQIKRIEPEDPAAEIEADSEAGGTSIIQPL